MTSLKIFRKHPLISLIFLLTGFLIILYLFRWYGPTPHCTLRLFIKALQQKDAETIWKLCGGDFPRSMKGVELDDFLLPPKEKFIQFLQQYVFQRFPENVSLTWKHHPIITSRRFLWFSRHSKVMFYFSLHGPNNFWMPVAVQKIFGRWIINPRRTFQGYLREIFRRHENLSLEQANLKAGKIWTQLSGR
jgi:hypothetical protein